MQGNAAAMAVKMPQPWSDFGSKKGLYLAVADRAGTQLIASMELLLARPDPTRRLRLGAQYLLGYIARHRDSWAVLFAKSVAGATVAARVRRYRERIVDMIAMMLAGLAPGQRGIEARRYALALIGAGAAITNGWVNQNEVSLKAMSTPASDIVGAVSKA